MNQISCEHKNYATSLSDKTRCKPTSTVQVPIPREACPEPTHVDRLIPHKRCQDSMPKKSEICHKTGRREGAVWPAEQSSMPVPATTGHTAGASNTRNGQKTKQMNPINARTDRSTPLHLMRVHYLPKFLVLIMFNELHKTANTVHFLNHFNVILSFMRANKSVFLARSFQSRLFDPRRQIIEKNTRRHGFFCGSGSLWPRHVTRGVFITHTGTTLQGNPTSSGP